MRRDALAASDKPAGKRRGPTHTQKSNELFEHPLHSVSNGTASGVVPPPYSDFLDSEVPREKPKNPKNYPKLASDSSGTLKIGFSVKFYIYI